MKKSEFIIIPILLFSLNTFSQIEQIFSARDDAQTYLNHYLNPAINGLMYNLNNGWYSSGKTHSKLGFDITLTASASMIPNDEKSFIFNATEYNYLTINGSNNELPTVAGGDTETTITASNEDGSVTFNALNGIGNKWPENFFIPVSVPTPMVQAGLGLPGGTDVKLRYFPKSKNEEVSYELMGLGVQHDLTQHFKILDKIPTLHVSALGAYTHSKLVYIPKDSPVDGENQKLEMNVNSYTLQAIGDIDLKVVNFYLGMGYTAGSTKLNALGTYQYDYDNNGSYSSDEIITDPLNMKFTINGFKTTAGVRFNLGPVKLFADYTLQKYPAISTGLAISIR